MRGAVKIALLGIAVAIGIGIIGLFVWLMTGPEGGVKMANEMDQYALDYLERHQILDAEEKLICYYDATVALNGSEAAILTTDRLLYHKQGRTTALPLAEIDDIQHHYESLIGDVIVVRTASGEMMKIEIAPFNGGETFVTALKNSWTQATGRTLED